MNTRVQATTWTHVAVTVDGIKQETRLYFDGEGPAGTFAIAENEVKAWTTAPALRLGAFGDFSAFAGSLDELVIVGRVLAPDEIRALAGHSDDTAKYLEALRAVQALRRSQDTLAAVQVLDADVSTAQQAVAQAETVQQMQVEADKKAKAAEEERKTQDKAVLDAEQEAAKAQTPQQQEAARSRLVQVRAGRDKVIQRQYADLDQAIRGLESQEELLTTLSPHLDKAVDNSVQAAMAAVQRHNIEVLIGPWLNTILGIKDAKYKTAWQDVYPPTLLAAQLALKSETDGAVDAARAKYEAALEARDQAANSSKQQDTARDIIKQIDEYITMLNKDVDSAKIALDKAIADQRGKAKDAQMKDLLADALARELASQVTTQAILRTQSATGQPDVLQLLGPKTELTQQIADSLRGRLFTSLEMVREPARRDVRALAKAAVAQLSGDIAAGSDLAPLRAAKTNLRDRLASLETALNNVLNARQALLRPASGIDALLKQAAEESSQATTQDELQRQLQQAVKDAEDAMTQFTRVQTVAGGAGAGVSQLSGLAGQLGVTLPGSTAASTGGTGTTAAGSGTGGATAAGGTGSGGTTGSAPAASGGAGTGGAGSGATAGGASTGGTSGSGATTGTGTGTATTGSTGGTGTGGAVTVAGVTLDAGAITQQVAEKTGLVEASGQAAAATGSATTAAPQAVQPWNAPDFWAGLILMRDGHVAVVTGSANDSKWSYRPDDLPVPVGQWVHYAARIVFDRNGDVAKTTGDKPDLVLTRNGAPTKGDAQAWDRPAISGCPPGFYIGGLCTANPDYGFDGRIDEVRVWKQPAEMMPALNEDGRATNWVRWLDLWRKHPGEVLGEHAAEAAAQPGGVLGQKYGAVYGEVAYWPFDELQGGPAPAWCTASGGANTQTCDYGPGHYNLGVFGPAWVPADGAQLVPVSVRP